MVGKTPLILAPLIVGAALLLLAFFMGRWFERAQRAWRASQLDPRLYEEFVGFVRGVLSPTDLEDPPYLPAAVREEGVKLVAREHDRKLKVRREELRRRGF